MAEGEELVATASDIEPWEVAEVASGDSDPDKPQVTRTLKFTAVGNGMIVTEHVTTVDPKRSRHERRSRQRVYTTRSTALRSAKDWLEVNFPKDSPSW